MNRWESDWGGGSLGGGVFDLQAIAYETVGPATPRRKRRDSHIRWFGSTCG